MLRSSLVPPKGTERVIPSYKNVGYETSVRYLNSSPNYYLCKVPFKHSYPKFSAWHLHLWHEHLQCHSCSTSKPKLQPTARSILKPRGEAAEEMQFAGESINSRQVKIMDLYWVNGLRQNLMGWWNQIKSTLGFAHLLRMAFGKTISEVLSDGEHPHSSSPNRKMFISLLISSSGFLTHTSLVWLPGRRGKGQQTPLLRVSLSDSILGSVTLHVNVSVCLHANSPHCVHL